MTLKEEIKRENDIAKCKYHCKCGHVLVITNKMDKALCKWCGNYVYKDKKKEFIEKLKKQQKSKNLLTF